VRFLKVKTGELALDLRGIDWVSARVAVSRLRDSVMGARKHSAGRTWRKGSRIVGQKSTGRASATGGNWPRKEQESKPKGRTKLVKGGGGALRGAGCEKFLALALGGGGEGHERLRASVDLRGGARMLWKFSGGGAGSLRTNKQNPTAARDKGTAEQT